MRSIDSEDIGYPADFHPSRASSAVRILLPDGPESVKFGTAGLGICRGACYDRAFGAPIQRAPSVLRVPIVQRPRTWPFQGQNTGSNPVGDATACAAPDFS